MHVLVLNCGSSSIKAAVICAETGQAGFEGLAERLGSPEAKLKYAAGDEEGSVALGIGDHAQAMTAILDVLAKTGLADGLTGVGHRVVHGGERFSASCLIDDVVLGAVEEMSGLAPLHNPPNLAGIRAARATFPKLPQVAVFDTAFHQSMPQRAYRYALPEALYRDHGVRRYGFHGTSFRYVAGEAARRLSRAPDDCALLIAHLGNGCSAAAVLNGESVDTSMGLTPLEGLVMGTRSGDVDPGLFEYLERVTNKDTHAVTSILNKQSGLLGLSGLSNDVRTLLKAAVEGHAGANMALDVYSYRLAKSLSALSAALPRIDALVFTGGVGENAVSVRADTLGRLGNLGFTVDPEANQTHGAHTNADIAAAGSLPVLVVPTHEELMIARDTAAIISGKES